MEIILAAVFGYAIGSAPVVYAIARARGVNLREAGTGNLGGGNLWAQTGRWVGAAGVASDLAKGVGSVLVIRALGMGTGAEAATAATVVAGQMWPATLGFNGGRGNVTAAGSLTALSPWMGTAAWIVMLVPMAPKLLSVFSRRAGIVGTTTRVTPIAVLAALSSYAVITFGFGEYATAAAGGAVTGMVLLRRLTAPWPPDPSTGQAPERSLASALLFDRPSSTPSRPA